MRPLTLASIAEAEVRDFFFAGGAEGGGLDSGADRSKSSASGSRLRFFAPADAAVAVPALGTGEGEGRPLAISDMRGGGLVCTSERLTFTAADPVWAPLRSNEDSSALSYPSAGVAGCEALPTDGFGEAAADTVGVPSPSSPAPSLRCAPRPRSTALGLLDLVRWCSSLVIDARRSSV